MALQGKWAPRGGGWVCVDLVRHATSQPSVGATALRRTFARSERAGFGNGEEEGVLREALLLAVLGPLQGSIKLPFLTKARVQREESDGQIVSVVEQGIGEGLNQRGVALVRLGSIGPLGRCALHAARRGVGVGGGDYASSNVG